MVQKTVGLYPEIGLDGQQVAFGQASYTPENYISDGTVRAGSFAYDATPEDSGGAVQFGVASATGDVLLGFVERTFTADLDSHVPASLVYPEGENLTIARAGDYYITAPADAEIGQSVLCVDGEISFGSSGDDGDTGWVVAKAGSEGDVIIITWQSAAAVSSSSDDSTDDSTDDSADDESGGDSTDEAE